MDNAPQDQSSVEKLPSSSSAPPEAAANPRSGQFRVCRAPTNSNPVTSSAQSRLHHVSGQLIAKEESKVAADSAKPPRGNNLDRQVEHTSPHNHTAESESRVVSKQETKRDTYSAAKTNKKKSKPKQGVNMCNMAESTEEKMHEIPLTKEPAAAPKKKKLTKKGQTSGRWTHEEHEAFLQGLQVFGREWKKVAEQIPTRTSAQIRSHAQKYFSKIAKDEGILLHEQQQQQPLVAPAAQPEGHQFPVSVQRTAERIMANPTSVQMEVEDTLRQLRERYRQLQIRLEQSQRSRGLPPMDRIIEEEEQGGDDFPVGRIHHRGAPGMDRRKRSLEEVLEQHQEDGASSVASDLSHSLASLSPSRELDNEELIALHVLGGTLRRSASGTELHQSSPSSSFSEAEDSQVKRQRLEEEEESNDQAANDEDKKEEHGQDGGDDQAMT